MVRNLLSSMHRHPPYHHLHQGPHTTIFTPISIPQSITKDDHHTTQDPAVITLSDTLFLNKPKKFLEKQRKEVLLSSDLYDFFLLYEDDDETDPIY